VISNADTKLGYTQTTASPLLLFKNSISLSLLDSAVDRQVFAAYGVELTKYFYFSSTYSDLCVMIEINFSRLIGSSWSDGLGVRKGRSDR
jgi:hypothetical protein